MGTQETILNVVTNANNNSSEPTVKKTTVEMFLPHDVTFILLRLVNKGYAAYVVGGCVRDTICNQLFETNYPIHDYDITTDATPKQIMEVFNAYKIIPTGLKHGTVTVLLNNKTYEITTYRKESDYSDHRHADKIEFVGTLKEDLSRRDLTINAIAYNPLEGFVDPFNGMLDIYNKTIRCVGNPNERLQEDALRILRVVRFASTRGFTIEEETRKAICNPDNYKWLKHISRERITDELRKMLKVNPCLIDTSEKVDDLIGMLHCDYLDMFNTILPGFYLMYDYTSSYSNYTFMLGHNLATLFNLRREFSSDYSFSTCMVALFHDVGKHFAKRIYDDYTGADDFPNLGEKSVELFRRSVLPCLRLSNKEIKEIELLILHYDDIIVCNKQFITEKLLELGSLEAFKQLYQLQVADYLDNLYSSNPKEHLTYLENSYKLACELVNNKEVCFQIKDLNISGDDIIELLNLEPGPVFCEILKKLLDEVNLGNLKNTKEELTKYILDNFNEK